MCLSFYKQLFLLITIILTFSIFTFGCGERSTVDGDVDGDLENSDGDTELADDNIAPEFKSLRVSVNGEFAAEYDLDKDVSYVLPAEAEVVFAVFVTDDVTDSENIVVKIHENITDTDIVAKDTSFNNGLWRVTTNVSPGQKIIVNAYDKSGNKAESEYSFIVPERSEAMVGQWDKRIYNDEQVIESLWNLEFKEDLSWIENRPATNQTLDGNYYFENEKLQMEGIIPELTLRLNEIDPSTFRRESEYYVDNTYFSMEGYTRISGESSIVGSWQREYSYSLKNGEQWDEYYSITETLIFDENGEFSIKQIKNSDSEEENNYRGSYQVVVNESYMDNYGNFLQMQIENINGATVSSEEKTFDLHVIRSNHLLIKPYILLQQK